MTDQVPEPTGSNLRPTQATAPLIPVVSQVNICPPDLHGRLTYPFLLLYFNSTILGI